MFRGTNFHKSRKIHKYFETQKLAKFAEISSRKIQENLYINWENSKIGVTITTDLSSAYDTIDHITLLKKLRHYGITGESNLLFESYLIQLGQYIKNLVNLSSDSKSLQTKNTHQKIKPSG